MATRVRALVGPNATVGAEFDLHAHPTPALLAACDVMVYYKEYPHVDIKERARELFSLCESNGKRTPSPPKTHTRAHTHR